MASRKGPRNRRVSRWIPIAIASAIAASGLEACDRERIPNVSAASAPARADGMAQEAHPAEAAIVAPAAVGPLPTPDSLTDTAISARIKASLVTDPGMAGADISVNTDRGVVNLTGEVTSREQAAIASSHAQRQDGVMRIDSHLAVNTR